MRFFICYFQLHILPGIRSGNVIPLLVQQEGPACIPDLGLFDPALQRLEIDIAGHHPQQGICGIPERNSKRSHRCSCNCVIERICNPLMLLADGVPVLPVIIIIGVIILLGSHNFAAVTVGIGGEVLQLAVIPSGFKINAHTICIRISLQRTRQHGTVLIQCEFSSVALQRTRQNLGNLAVHT